MHRIDGDGAVPDLNGAGRNGFTQTPPNETQVTADWLNDVQENIARAIELAGITIVKGTFTQLYDAIVALIVSGIAGKVTGPASATDNAVARFDLTTGKLVQNSGVLIEDDNDVTGVKDLTLSGETLYTTPKSRVVLVPACVFYGDPVYWKLHSSGDYMSSPANGGTAEADLNALVPSGATITKIRALVQEGNTTPMTLAARRRTVSGTTITTAFSTGPHSSAGSTVLNWIDSGTISLLGGASSARDVGIASTNAAGDRIYLLEITYTDTGPINAT